MELVCTYIESENFEKTVEFYKKVLQIEPNEFCANRWVEFECGNKLSIYNKNTMKIKLIISIIMKRILKILIN